VDYSMRAVCGGRGGFGRPLDVVSVAVKGRKSHTSPEMKHKQILLVDLKYSAISFLHNLMRVEVV
jgi:hypothetical protein